MKEQVIKALDEKFLYSDKFAQKIETLVKDYKISYIDAIVQFCDQNSVEVETIPKLISKPLKEKLKCEATKLNFLKKTSKAVSKF